MFSKIEVNGDGACDLYRFLKSSQGDGADISWNFEKYSSIFLVSFKLNYNVDDCWMPNGMLSVEFCPSMGSFARWLRSCDVCNCLSLFKFCKSSVDTSCDSVFFLSEAASATRFSVVGDSLLVRCIRESTVPTPTVPTLLRALVSRYCATSFL